MPEVNGRWVADMKLPRTPDNEEPALERACDFRPVDKGFTEEMAIAEASRCMRCKRPLCVQGCPVNIDIPTFITHIYNREFGAALDTIRESSMLPAICGRVCPQENQCEGKCIRGRKGDPVAIGQLERFLGDQPELASKPHMKPANGKKVAVIGSGPSGITCAGELARNGFDVTVFEAFFTGGGVLVYGIPEFRLPKAVVKREIDGLKELGVKFEFNSVMGRLADAEELLGEKGFDAIYVATGAGLPKFLNIPGENLPNVFFANEYLTRVNLMKANEFPAYDTPTKHGKNVVVFGGGNVAMDAARTALRLGAEEVHLIYRRTEVEMPARAEEVHHAKEEGVQFHMLVNAKRILGEGGRVNAIECLRYELGEPDASGRRRPVAIPGSEYTMPVDAVIVAVGNGSNPLIKATTPGLETDAKGHIVADENGQTSLPRVFAGGDIVLGAATVILAMGEGRKAAAAINRLLAR